MPLHVQRVNSYPSTPELGGPVDDLLALKDAFEVLSTTQGVLTPLGRLDHDSGGINWQGLTSLDRRVQSGELTNRDIEIATQQLASHFMPTTPGAAERCVEARTKADYNTNSAQSFGAPLGPQVQGATPDRAVAYRLSRIIQGFHRPNATMNGDLKRIGARGSTFKPGGHTAKATAIGKSGCGSVDSQEQKIDALIDPNTAAALGEKTAVILGLGGLTLTTSEIHRPLPRAATLMTQMPGYFMQPTEIMDVVRKMTPDGVPHVEGDHKAISVTLNYVPETTFHPSEYNARMRAMTGKEIHNYNLDVWHILREHPPHEAAILITQAINTLAHLTDGSLLLFARTA